MPFETICELCKLSMLADHGEQRVLPHTWLAVSISCVVLNMCFRADLVSNGAMMERLHVVHPSKTQSQLHNHLTLLAPVNSLSILGRVQKAGSKCCMIGPRNCELTQISLCKIQQLAAGKLRTITRFPSLLASHEKHVQKTRATAYLPRCSAFTPARPTEKPRAGRLASAQLSTEAGWCGSRSS